MFHLNSFSQRKNMKMETLWLVIYILKEISQQFNRDLFILNLIEIYFNQQQSPKSKWLQKDD